MNYFELFNIPESLKVDKRQLSGIYFTLQKRYHPDMFVQAAAEEQAAALEKSSMINKAYKTLQDPDATIKYVLQEKGLLQEEEKYQLSPDFLMEMMELNEALTDAGNDAEAMAMVNKTIDHIQKEIYEPVEAVIANYQEGITSEKELLQVKEYYYRKKYLDRVRSGLS